MLHITILTDPHRETFTCDRFENGTMEVGDDHVHIKNFYIEDEVVAWFPLYEINGFLVKKD